MNDNKRLYLELMKKCLTYYIWGETSEVISLAGSRQWRKKLILGSLIKFLKRYDLQVTRKFKFDPKLRQEGRDWPPLAHTMIGIKRLDNIQECIEDVITNNIPGDVIETGVWRGGASIFMRAVLKAHGITNRVVWVADSFEGLPRPDAENYPEDRSDAHYLIDFLAVPLNEVKTNFARYGLLDEQVKFLKGWFKDTLPKAPIKKLAVMRLDGDMYESTMDALLSLYPKLSVGGYVIIDDYVLEGCRKAVHDFRAKYSITNEMINIDRTAVYWQRTK